MTNPAKPTKSVGLVTRVVPTLYEDDYLLAVNKPAGVDTGGRQDEPSSGLVELLTEVRGKHAKDLQAINRLSRFESGILLLAKDTDTAIALRKELRGKKITQTYLAIVIGRMTKPRTTIESIHGASRGRRGTKTEASRSNRPTATKPKEVEARTMLTRVREGETGNNLVRCQTRGQTTHALRAQLRAVDFRLLGDARGSTARRTPGVEKTLLHLSEVSLPQANTRHKLQIKTPPPRELEHLLQGKIDVDRLLRAALTRRLPFMAIPTTNAWRLITGPAEYLDDLIAEQFGDVIILQVLNDREDLLRSLRGIAQFYINILNGRAVYLKRFVKDRGATDPELRESLFSPTPFMGSQVAPQIEVHEGPLRFAIRPYDGFSVGLFPDQRDNRARVRTMTAGKDVLNLFAYTCGFSAAAAAGGAKMTTSVDLFPKHLEWGKVNFKLNNLDPAAHEFVAADAVDYLTRADKHERRFDMIIIDAPTFAHGRKAGKDFSIVRDMPALVTGASRLLRAEGTLMISTNHRKMSFQDIREKIKQGAGRRRFEIVETPLLPLDYAVDPDHAKTVFIRFA